ncbi:MAG TPA: type II secretion system protein, partial [bacterium]|nr:type II secretion system protein [bacterium]
MSRRPASGFTLIELLVVITIIGILAAIALPNYIKAKDKAKEVQTKSAVKAIQVAVERYQVDAEQFPLYLLGGDVEGWKHWHERYDEPNPDINDGANAWVRDPLVAFGYLDSYPLNPFVDDGVSVLAQTGPVDPSANGYQPGDGDPRFGFRGNTMGNGLEATQVFANWFNNIDQNIETYRTLWTTTGGDPGAKGFGMPLQR